MYFFSYLHCALPNICLCTAFFSFQTKYSWLVAPVWSSPWQCKQLAWHMKEKIFFGCNYWVLKSHTEWVRKIRLLIVQEYSKTFQTLLFLNDLNPLWYKENLHKDRYLKLTDQVSMGGRVATKLAIDTLQQIRLEAHQIWKDHYGLN